MKRFLHPHAFSCSMFLYPSVLLESFHIPQSPYFVFLRLSFTIYDEGRGVCARLFLSTFRAIFFPCWGERPLDYYEIMFSVIIFFRYDWPYPLVLGCVTVISRLPSK